MKAATTLATLAAAVVLAGVVPAGPGLALADEPPADEPAAARLFREGNELYLDGKYPEAEQRLQRSFELKPVFDTAANLGDCELKIGQDRDAAEHLRFALANLPNSTSDEKKKVLEQLYAAARTAVGEVAVDIQLEGAEVKLDDRTVGVTPLSETLFVEPGSHTLGATKPGHAPASRRFEVKPAIVTHVVLTLDELGGGPSAALLGVGYGLGGAAIVAGAVLVGVGASKAGSADDKTAALQAQYGPRPCDPLHQPECSDIKTLRSQFDTLAPAGIGLLAGGAALAIATGVYHGIAAAGAGGGDEAAPPPADAARLVVLPLAGFGTDLGGGAMVMARW